MRNLLFLFVSILIFWALFSQPLKEIVASFEAGFAIERLTFLPEGYPDVEGEKYFTLSRYVPGNNVVDTEYRSGDSYFRFVQSVSNFAMETYTDALDAGTFYKKDSFRLNETVVTVTYYHSEDRRFTWLIGSKRYDLITNDLGISGSTVEEIQRGLVLAKVDFWRSIKKIWGSFIATTDLLSTRE